MDGDEEEEQTQRESKGKEKKCDGLDRALYSSDLHRSDKKIKASFISAPQR